jgi:tRNA threonylcarbamoyladenosine biosynthesis protein TsaB
LKILAVDTSQKTASVAILADNVIRADVFVDSGRHHSEILLPAIENVLRLADLGVDEMDLFAVTIGPGSFTGLRIGAATIKGLSLATGKPVVGVSTLDALAHDAAHTDKRIICPMLDAQRNQVYTALYRPVTDSRIEKIAEEQVVAVDAWLEKLTGEILFLGDGAVRYSALIHTRFASLSFVAQGHRNHVRAATVAVLARDKFQQGLMPDLLTFAPCYLRPSEAEARIRDRRSDVDRSAEFR